MQSLTDGGIINDESRFFEPYLQSVLNSYRAYFIKDMYLKTGEIVPNCYQTHYADRIVGLDDKCNSFYQIPTVLQIGSNLFGVGASGGLDVDTGSESNELFRIAQTKGIYANNQQHRITKNRSTKLNALYIPSRSMMQVDNPDLSSIFVNAVFTNPFKCNQYNLESDDYPLDDATIDMILDALNRGTLRTIIQVPQNKISNSADDKSIPSNKK